METNKNSKLTYSDLNPESTDFPSQNFNKNLSSTLIKKYEPQVQSRSPTSVFVKEIKKAIQCWVGSMVIRYVKHLAHKLF